jgi:ribosomal-protein-alanine N-acetyltransferase
MATEATQAAGDFPVLETPRLVLREIVAADAAALHAIQGDAELMRWFGSDPLPDEAAASALIETFAGWRKGVMTGTRWALQPRGESELIGTCGLFGWHRAWKKCLVGYELAQARHGHGYMREALQAILDWGFDNMALHRVEALIHPMNQPSLRLAASLGFVQEGLLREVGCWGGRHHDMLQLSLLRREHLADACPVAPSQSRITSSVCSPSSGGARR